MSMTPESRPSAAFGTTALLDRPAGSETLGAGATAATTIPVRCAESPPQRPRRLGGVAGGGARNVIGAAVSGLCVALLLFGRLAPLSGFVGFVICAYAMFLIAYSVLVSLDDDSEVVRDRLITMVLWTAAVILCSALVFVILFIFVRGEKAIFHANLSLIHISEPTRPY